MVAQNQLHLTLASITVNKQLLHFKSIIEDRESFTKMRKHSNIILFHLTFYWEKEIFTNLLYEILICQIINNFSEFFLKKHKTQAFNTSQSHGWKASITRTKLLGVWLLTLYKQVSSCQYEIKYLIHFSK